MPIPGNYIHKIAKTSWFQAAPYPHRCVDQEEFGVEKSTLSGFFCAKLTHCVAAVER